MKKFTYETRRACGDCKREVDAVRVVGEPGQLLVSRHLATIGFCGGSLVDVPARGQVAR